MKYIATDLIEAIKRNASIPSSQVRWSNDDFLKFTNEELQLSVVGELVSMRQDYFVETSDTALAASTSAYAFPTSAIGWKLESIGYVDSDGNYTRLPIVTRDARDSYESLSTSSAPRAVYVLGNKVNTIPSMGTSVTGSLRFEFVRIQNEVVLESQCGLITSVNDTGTVYEQTVDSIPVENAAAIDVVSGTNPFGIIARGVTASISGSVISVTYGSDYERAPVAGDYICAAGKTPYPNIPEDFHAVLAMATARRCLVASNDAQGVQMLDSALANFFDKMRKRASRRVNDAPRKLVANNYVLNMMRKY